RCAPAQLPREHSQPATTATPSKQTSGADAPACSRAVPLRDATPLAETPHPRKPGELKKLCEACSSKLQRSGTGGRLKLVCLRASPAHTSRLTSAHSANSG